MNSETTTPAVYAVTIPLGNDFGEETSHLILYATGEPDVIKNYVSLGGETWYRQQHGENAKLGQNRAEDVSLREVIRAPLPHLPLWELMFMFPKPFASEVYVFDESEEHVREIGLQQYDAQYELARKLVEDYYANERRGELATKPELPTPEHRLWIMHRPVKHITEDLLKQKTRLYDQLRFERDVADAIIRRARAPVEDLERRIDELGEPDTVKR